MTFEEEKALLNEFLQKAEKGEIVTPQIIRQEYEKRIGRATADTTIYRMLKRHKWRKIKPRPRHPKGKPEEQTLFKKIS